MDDIVPSLLESIQNEFKDRWKKNQTVAKTWKKIKNKTATYEDANDFAVAVGEMLEQSYKRFISADTLPEGRMWYNIATRILEPTLHNNYELISQVCEEAQATVNEQSGIGLKAIKPTYNTERVNGFIDKISNAEDFEDVAWLLGEPIVNYSQSVVDDSIRQNADFQAASGLTPKIRRILAPSEKRTTMSGHKKVTYYVPCPWCAALAGEYNYPNVPRDVFRRHENCRCTLEYVVGNKKQNPWYTKTKWEEERQERIDETEKIQRTYQTREDIKNALLQDVGFESVDSNLFRNNFDLLKDNTDQLIKLEERFGAIKKSHDSHIKSDNSRGANAYTENSVYDPSRQSLSLCHSKYGLDYDAFIEEKKQAIQNGISMPCADSKISVYTVTHEYGHALQNILLKEEMERQGWSASTPYSMIDRTKKTQNARAKWYTKTEEAFAQQCYDEIIGIAKSNNENFSLADNLSGYGKTNKLEFFAEVFANSQLGEPNELGEAMIEWLIQKGF